VSTAPDTPETDPWSVSDQPESEPIETESEPIETYQAATEAYLSEASWLTSADAPFRLHALNIARSLDLQMRTKGEVQSALASTYAKVLVMLDKRRPAATFDPLRQGTGPHGEQSIFGLPLDG
jgi:hypothetical protein